MKKVKRILFICLICLSAISNAQNVGIGQTAPTNTLHITPITTGTDPLRIDGLQAFSVGDTAILMINPTTGIVKKINASQLGSIIGAIGVDTDIDSLSLIGTILTAYENGTAVSVDLAGLPIDTASIVSIIYNYGDTLLSNQTFINNLGDTLINNSTFINNLRDSIDTDIDSLILAGTILTAYENGNSASADLAIFLELPSTAVTGQVLTWNGTSWVAQNPGAGADNWGTQVVQTSGSNISGNGLAATPLIVNTNDPDSVVGNEYNTSFVLNGSNLEITDGGGTIAVPMSAIQAALNINDADSVVGNEYNTSFVINGANLEITDGGGTFSVPLTSINSNDWKLLGNAGTTAGTNFIGTTDAVDFVVKTNNIENIRVLSAGGVGIGTNLPQGKLDVKGIGTTLGTYAFGVRNSTNAYSLQIRDDQLVTVSGLFHVPGINLNPLGQGAYINWNNNAIANTGNGLPVNQGANHFINQRGTGPGGFSFDFFDNTNTFLSTPMIIRGSGNVGIGTVNPIQPFHVNGVARAEGVVVIGPDPGSPTTEGGQVSLEKATNGALSGTLDMYTLAGNNASGIRLFPGGVMTDGLYISDGNYQTLGNIGIGTVTPSFKVSIFAPAAAASAGILSLRSGGLPSPFVFKIGTVFGGYTNTTGILYLELGGAETYMFGGEVIPDSDANWNLGAPTQRWQNVYASNGTINTSDIRQKTNIKPLTYGLKELMQINPIIFNWKDKNIGTQAKIGFSAQELQQILPEVVSEGDDDNKTLGVYYSDVIPVVVNATQEQQKEIEDLKAKNQELENRLKILEEKLNQVLNK